MTYVLAIDPGTTKSAWVVVDSDKKPVAWAWEENETVLGLVRDNLEGLALLVEHLRPNETWDGEYETELVIEDVQLMGMPAGRDVFETVKWAGRFDANCRATWISRPTVKAFICGSARATDANVKQGVIDLYGGQEKAIGGVKCDFCNAKGTFPIIGTRGRYDKPELDIKYNERYECEVCLGRGRSKTGILYEFSKAGMGSHGWSALALALTAMGQ